MKICLIKFLTMQDVHKFVHFMGKLSNRCYLTHETYRIDAKSLLGILSLNLEDDVILEIDNYNEDDKNQIFLKLELEGFQISEIK